MKPIYDLTFEQLQQFLIDNNIKPFHTKQIFRWLYEKRIDDFSSMCNLAYES